MYVKEQCDVGMYVKEWLCSSADLIVTDCNKNHTIPFHAGSAKWWRNLEHCQRQAQTQAVCCLPGVASAACLTTGAAASQKRGGHNTMSWRLLVPYTSILRHWGKWSGHGIIKAALQPKSVKHTLSNMWPSSIMHKYFLGPRFGRSWQESGKPSWKSWLAQTGKALNMLSSIIWLIIRQQVSR